MAIVNSPALHYNKHKDRYTGGTQMISYDRLWQTMKEKGISQYKLLKEYNISSGTLDKLRKNTHITTYTLENLCRILQCRIEDIVEYIPDEESPETR